MSSIEGKITKFIPVHSPDKINPRTIAYVEDDSFNVPYIRMKENEPLYLDELRCK